MTSESDRGTERERHERLQAEYRREMDPETERLRMLQVERERTRQACETLADLYAALNRGQWAEKGCTINRLAEIVAEEVLGARAQIRRLERQLATFTGISERKAGG
jgi:hypothetical protein